MDALQSVTRLILAALRSTACAALFPINEQRQCQPKQPLQVQATADQSSGFGDSLKQSSS